MLRIFLAAALVFAVMVSVKDGRILRNAGLTGSCTAVRAPVPASAAGEEWRACKPGKLEGRPDLKRDSCTAQGVTGKVEYWLCPAPVQGDVSRQ